MSGDRYNGWANYETWAVALWIDNEQASQEYWCECAIECIKSAPDHRNVPKIWTAEEAARFTLADAMKDETERLAPDLGASMFADLLNAALSEVNWDELAQHYIETARETME